MGSQGSWWGVRWVAWANGLTSIALMVAALVFMFVDRNVVLPEVSDAWSLSNVFHILVHMGVPVLGIVIASRRPQNVIGWLLLLAGVALGLNSFSRAYALHSLSADPGSLPGGLVFGWIANAVGPIPIATLPFLFLLFPDGHIRSPRWRPVARFSSAVLVLAVISSAIFASSIWTRPFTLEERARSLASLPLTLYVIALFAIPVAALLSFASLAERFAKSVGEERLQLTWFVTAALPVAVAFTVAIITDTPLASTVFDVTLLFLYVAIGIAVLKHRLYDIDAVIDKAIVYGALASLITVVYVAVVVVVGAFAGATAFLSLVATAIVGIAFQPARDRAKRAANRLIYGERASPYEVLSGFAEHVGEMYAGEDILPRMARLLAEGTGATDATVWLRVGSEMRPAASWPVPDEPRSSVVAEGEELPLFLGVDAAAPVRHGTGLLGALTLTKPPNDPLRPEEDKLLAHLAAQAGLVLENVRLIEDIRSSRQRLVAAHDEERRRLERDLHDGAQQQLVALAVRVRMVEGLIGQDEQRQREALDGIIEDAQGALETLRDLARGIYPPLLADRGLPDAIEAQARKVPVAVTVEHDGVSRYPPEIEAAVYFSVLEAMQNVAKYANASNIVVRLHSEQGDLSFSVSDDGKGFRKETTPYGMGLQNIADRLAALDGTFDLRSAPGEGTTVSGRIPRPADARRRLSLDGAGGAP